MFRPILLAMTCILFAACANNANSGVARTPSMAPAESNEPAKRPWLERAGENTWNAVTAPGRWVQNAMPKKAPTQQPEEPLEPAEAIIIERP